jgi:hypothetical protein
MCHVWSNIAARRRRAAITTKNGHSTGAVGGKETGQRMSEYIIPDGPFVHAFAKLAATGWALNLQSARRPAAIKGPNDSKTTFTCPSCGWNVWGKPDTAVFCKPCSIAKGQPIELRAKRRAASSYDQQAAE